MLKKIIIPVIFFASHIAYSQSSFQTIGVKQADVVSSESLPEIGEYRQFTATSEFLDAAINFINSFTK